MIDWVGDAISWCNPPTVTVTRYAAPVVIAGRRQALVEDSTFPIVASIQPLSPQELQQLPEGMRTQGVKKVYTQTELFTVETAESKVADRFDYKDVTYMIKSKADWDDYGDYFKFLAVRIDR